MGDFPELALTDNNYGEVESPITCLLERERDWGI